MDNADILAQQSEEHPEDISLIVLLADALQEKGWEQSANYLRTIGPDNGDSGDGVGDSGDGVGSYGVGGDGVGSYGVGGDGGVGDDGVGGDGGVGDGGVGGVGGGGVGDGGGGVGGDGGGGVGGVGNCFKFKSKTSRWTMTNGFYILVIKGGYYPYVLVGWVERNDLILSLKNSRIIKRFGNKGQLSKMAKVGAVRHSICPSLLLDLSKLEYVPISSVVRAIPADPQKWKECPKPKDFRS